jgi:hypothetical protein
MCAHHCWQLLTCQMIKSEDYALFTAGIPWIYFRLAE